MKKELINLKIDGSFESILQKHSENFFISKPQLVQVLLLLLEEGNITEEDMKKRLMKGL